MKPGAILEAALYADDLDAAEAFYGGVLGLERILRAGNRHVFYRCGGVILLIFNPDKTEEPGSGPLPVPAHGARGPGHLCFSATATEIDAWRAALEAANVAIEADFRWPNRARSIYFRDPAGNSLEFAERALWFEDADPQDC
ncbi:glyoxalase/bleomycin resistance/extradiol dioxygenase family protein [Pikeienuella piscinae]|uniref:Glyoxalase/bleomycin resistance/extradiol dioxygenase family protein n=1 Tax=Pikeienuella piscinae TaxID=2748098 RepID=A0A7L5BXX8_9RHOB|nr:VOC family protein [Pikeienuella piscinae]QIE55377.1 glyoxalase/bleomycin resistance/extradiol dioxygenase family protein [Pikeienuella piscinae]